MIGTIAILEKQQQRKTRLWKNTINIPKICLYLFKLFCVNNFSRFQTYTEGFYDLRDKGKPTIEFDHLMSLCDLNCTMHRFASFSNCFTLCYAADAVLAAWVPTP